MDKLIKSLLGVMENVDIGLIVFLSFFSIVLPALVSYLISVWLRNKDFKTEYYRLILNNRVAVYQQLQSTISALFIVEKSEDEGRFIHVEVVNPFTLQKLLKELNELQRNGSMWLSDELSYQVTVIMRFLRITFDDVESVSDRKKKAIDSYQVIQDMRKGIDELILKDLRELHHIRKFLRKRPSRFNQRTKKYKSLVKK